MYRKTCLVELVIQEALKKAKATGKPVVVTMQSMDTEASFDIEAMAKRLGINLTKRRRVP